MHRGGDYHEVEYFTKAYTEEVADALYSKTRNFSQTKQYTPRLMIIFTPCPPNLTKIFIKGGRINRLVVTWRMAKRGRLIVMIAVSIAILFLASGLPVTSNGSQNSGQNNPGGYVKYTLDLLNNTLINGNFVNKNNAIYPYGIAYDPSNGYIYVTDLGSDSVSVINGTTVIATIPVGAVPWGVAYDPSNGYLYVTDAGGDTVSVIDGKTNTFIAKILVGLHPVGVAYDPSNGYIYVTNELSDTVSVINGTTVIANITVGLHPVGVAYDPSNGYIYVTNFASGTVSIIATSGSTSSTSISSVTTSTTST